MCLFLIFRLTIHDIPRRTVKGNILKPQDSTIGADDADDADDGMMVFAISLMGVLTNSLTALGPP